MCTQSKFGGDGESTVIVIPCELVEESVQFGFFRPSFSASNSVPFSLQVNRRLWCWASSQFRLPTHKRPQLQLSQAVLSFTSRCACFLVLPIIVECVNCRLVANLCLQLDSSVKSLAWHSAETQLCSYGLLLACCLADLPCSQLDCGASIHGALPFAGFATLSVTQPNCVHALSSDAKPTFAGFSRIFVAPNAQLNLTSFVFAYDFQLPTARPSFAGGVSAVA